MNLWVFACKNLVNIRIGYERKMWAVSIVNEATSKQRHTKSQKMTPNSRGLLYSSADKTFTLPFVTTGFPKMEKVANVWPEEVWELPFEIIPLGNPRKLMALDVAKKAWPALQGKSNATHKWNGINGRTVFVPNVIEQSDWNRILKDLGNSEDTYPLSQ